MHTTRKSAQFLQVLLSALSVNVRSLISETTSLNINF